MKKKIDWVEESEKRNWEISTKDGSFNLYLNCPGFFYRRERRERTVMLTKDLTFLVFLYNLRKVSWIESTEVNEIIIFWWVHRKIHWVRGDTNPWELYCSSALINYSTLDERNLSFFKERTSKKKNYQPYLVFFLFLFFKKGKRFSVKRSFKISISAAFWTSVKLHSAIYQINLLISFRDLYNCQSSWKLKYTIVILFSQSHKEEEKESNLEEME